MSVIEAIIRLAVVGGLFAIAMLVLRKYGRKRAGGSTGPALQVTSRFGVARGSNLLVVQYGTRSLLIGATASRMTLLADVSDETVDFVAQQDETAEPEVLSPRDATAQTFAALLAPLTRKAPQ